MNTKKIPVAREENGTILVNFLADRMNISRGKAKSVVDSRDVLVNGRRVWMSRHALRKGDVVELLSPARAPSENTVKPAILHEDADYLIVNKPAGLLSNDNPASLEASLRKERSEPGIRAVHRLDRDTSGCILYARSDAAYERMIPLFQDRRVVKAYRAIVVGRLITDGKTVETPIDGQHALTKFRTLDAGRLATHLAVRIETGRTHQIRKHLASIRHPVLGDRQYGTAPGEALRAVLPARQMLHACELAFIHPALGTPVRVKAPLPPDFLACLRRLRIS